MAADTLDVLSLAEAKAVLKITDTNAARDTRLERAITAVSRALDDRYGPIVKRTIAEATYHPACWDLWVLGPIYSTPGITITEYDASGTAQVLTLEDFDTKPDHGYRLEARSGLGGGYTGRIKRTLGSIESTWGTVRMTHDAGRYANTAAVDPVFKEAASVALINWWQQVLASPAEPGVELETPGFRFPGFALPRAAMEIVPRTETRPIGLA